MQVAGVDGQLEAVLRARPRVFSCTFGMPTPEALRALRDQGLTIDGDFGVSLFKAVDVSGGASASVLSSKLHPFGTVTLTYPDGSVSTINAPNFLVRQVFGPGGNQIA